MSTGTATPARVEREPGLVLYRTMPSAAVLEDYAIPTVERIVDTVRRRLDDAK